MTLLEIMQEFCVRAGIPKPLVVMASRDEQLLQLVGLAHEVLDDMLTHYVWEALEKEAAWVSLAAENQGVLTALAPYGFLYIKNETIWDRTDQRPVYGPLYAAEWQADKALVSTGPFYSYRIRGGVLKFTPTMVAGHSMAFEYASEDSILDVDGVTYKKYFTADDDTFILNESMLLAGLRWKWKYEKGLRYAEDQRAYDELVTTHSARNGTKRTLSMNDDDCVSLKPGIYVQAGSIPTS